MLLDNPPEAEVQNISLRKILLGLLLGAFAGLFVVGVIAAALVFAYGTAGVGPLILGLFGGIGAVATWSSVAAIGFGIVGVCSMIGGFIGSLFSSSEEIKEVDRPSSDQENTNGSITIIRKLIGNTNHNDIKTQPTNNADKNDNSMQELNSIERINEKFITMMQLNYRPQVRHLMDSVNSIGVLSKQGFTTNEQKSTAINQKLNALTDSVHFLPATHQYRRDTLEYIKNVRKELNPLYENDPIVKSYESILTL